MPHRRIWIAVGITIILLGVMSAVGINAYNAGVAQGIASTSQMAVEQGGRAAAPYPYPYPYPWHGPWAYGFGWFPFPLLFLFLVFFLVRGFWGGPWRGRYRYDYGGVPPVFDEWHRRAHAQARTPMSEPDHASGSPAER
jgi:hypothetical protein